MASFGIRLCDKTNLCALTLFWAVALLWPATGLPPATSSEVIASILTAGLFVCTVVNMRGWLPLQNVVGSAVLTCGATWSFESAFQWAGNIAGHRIFSENQAIHPSWYLPLLWMVAIINARGVARLALRQARHWNGYGLWVIALASLLAALWMCVADAAIISTTSLWSWRGTSSNQGFDSQPAFLSLRNLLVGAVTLTSGMPWLLNKKPVVEPVNWQPLGIWFIGLTGIGMAAPVRDNWIHATSTVILLIIPTAFAFTGGMSGQTEAKPLKTPS